MSRVLLVVLALFLVQCRSAKEVYLLPEKNPTAPWNQYEEQFLKELWTVYPGWASGLGLKEYAAHVKLPNPAERELQTQFLQKQSELLKKIPRDQLTPSQMGDLALVENFLAGELWNLKTLQSFAWDPSSYNFGSAIAAVLESASMTPYEKWKALHEKLQHVPAYYEAAYASLSKPTREHTQLAVEQHAGLIDYLRNDVRKLASEQKVTPIEDQKELLARIDRAADSVEKYIGQLKTLLKKPASAFRSFRIGKALYGEKFKYDLQSSYSADEMYAKAIAAKKMAHGEMLKLTTELWPKYFGGKKNAKPTLKSVRSLIEKISQQHVKAEDFVAAAQKQIPELWNFIVQKDLLTLDSNKMLKVRETPSYQRGFAGASVDSPGPYDADRETYYNVSPVTQMPKAKQESYLREYNDYTLQILNIHEAVPGHYVQLVYSNKNPSLIKKIFGNGAMIEGWAVYTERMMLQSGYGNNSPELWLMYYKWFIRAVCNTILDISLHTRNMTQAQAMNLMLKEGFQEKSEAEGKWRRATYSQVQLASYFTGFTEIYELREELKKKQGAAFNLKVFHEKFLSYGSSPVPLIKSEMMKGTP